ncbi:hypothetical protein N8642_04715 [bacterium]|nr:hypothetical protein [bacterium]
MSNNSITKTVFICVALATFIASAGMWVMLTALPNLAPLGSRFPGLTTLFVDARNLLLLPPLITASITLWVLFRKQTSSESALLFTSASAAVMSIIFFPTLMAILLCFLQLFEDSAFKHQLAANLETLTPNIILTP